MKKIIVLVVLIASLTSTNLYADEVKNYFQISPSTDIERRISAIESNQLKNEEGRTSAPLAWFFIGIVAGGAAGYFGAKGGWIK